MTDPNDCNCSSQQRAESERDEVCVRLTEAAERVRELEQKNADLRSHAFQLCVRETRANRKARELLEVVHEMDSLHRRSRAECEGLCRELEAVREVCAAAVAWRRCDESEPIPSEKPNQALARVAFAVDDFLANDLSRLPEQPAADALTPAAIALADCAVEFVTTLRSWLTAGALVNYPTAHGGELMTRADYYKRVRDGAKDEQPAASDLLAQRYADIPHHEWFARAYDGKSLGGADSDEPLTRSGSVDSAAGRPADDVSADPAPDLCSACQSQQSCGPNPPFAVRCPEHRPRTDADPAPDHRDCRECANPCAATTSPGCAETCPEFFAAPPLAGAKPEAFSVETETPSAGGEEERHCLTCRFGDYPKNDRCTACIAVRNESGAHALPHWEADPVRVMTDAMKVSADALTAALARAEAAERELAEVRGRVDPDKLLAYCRDTFNGGHTGDDCKAFHHGMGTVINVLRAALTPAQEKDHG